MSRSNDRAKWIDLFKNKTGKTEFEMREVAEFALKNGYEPPEPVDVVDIVEKQLSRAARQQHRTDPKTGRTYRANHRIPKPGGGKGSIWFDIDGQPPRKKLLVSLNLRREQLVSDAVLLTNDAEHWSQEHPDEEPIHIQLDLSFDVELRRHAEDDEDSAIAS